MLKEENCSVLNDLVGDLDLPNTPPFSSKSRYTTHSILETQINQTILVLEFIKQARKLLDLDNPVNIAIIFPDILPNDGEFLGVLLALNIINREEDKVNISIICKCWDKLKKVLDKIFDGIYNVQYREELFPEVYLQFQACIC